MLMTTVAAARGFVNDGAADAQPSKTDFAEDRTILASERTFAAWMRTALAFIAVGIGFHAFFGELQPGWIPRTIASWFLLIAVATSWLAVSRAAVVLRRLSPHMITTARKAHLKLLAMAMSIGTIGIAAAFWLLPFA
jgi:putative membrane protein